MIEFCGVGRWPALIFGAMAMGLPGRVEQLIRPGIEALGFDIVQVRVSGQKRLRLQIMIERLDGKAVVVDDCARVSRDVSAILDVDDPIGGAFTLEVSSPGLDRPLVRIRDFERFVGFEAKIELKAVIDGRRRFRGQLTGIDGEYVGIIVDGEQVSLPYTEIDKAKLIITEDML